MNAHSSKTFLIAAMVLLTFDIRSSSALWAQAANAQPTPAPTPAPTPTQSSNRKIKVSSPPEYPELARKMNIQGVARVLLTVNPEGKVVGVKELGGNPVLVAALSQAVKKWKYEPADHDSEIEVRYEFAQSR